MGAEPVTLFLFEAGGLGTVTVGNVAEKSELMSEESQPVPEVVALRMAPLVRLTVPPAVMTRPRTVPPPTSTAPLAALGVPTVAEARAGPEPEP